MQFIYRRMKTFFCSLILLTAVACGTIDQVELATNLLWKDSAEWDSPDPKENWKNYKIGDPYRIEGKWYFPQENPDYDEVGIASWYGPGFHNKLTANGEIYNKFAMTGAHKTLPLPSVVKVKNLENGKSIRIRLNDRGPFVDDRIIDLSYTAAKQLGIDKKGTAKVRVTYDKKATHSLFYDSPYEDYTKPRRELARHITAPKTTTVEEKLAVNAVGDYFIQTGAYSMQNNAFAMQDQLRKLGRVRIQETNLQGKRLFRVQIGPFASVEEADKTLLKVHDVGFSDAIIIMDKTDSKA